MFEMIISRYVRPVAAVVLVLVGGLFCHRSLSFAAETGAGYVAPAMCAFLGVNLVVIGLFFLLSSRDEENRPETE